MKKTVLALCGLCCMSLAAAQSASDAAHKERMERAKRDASNPLRIIIEASQVKRTRSGGDAPAPVAATAPVVAKPTAESRAERRPARGIEPTPAPDTASRPLAAPSPAAGEPPATAAAAAPPTAAEETPAVGVAPAPRSTPAGPDAAAHAEVQAPSGMVPAAAGIAAAATAAASSQPAAAVLAPLKLVRYIEPEIPARIRSRLRPSSEVTVAFKVQPDGSVSQAAIRATSARALDPVVLEAVRQWRYDPVPEEREHVVQLVFNLTE